MQVLGALGMSITFHDQEVALSMAFSPPVGSIGAPLLSHNRPRGACSLAFEAPRRPAGRRLVWYPKRFKD